MEKGKGIPELAISSGCALAAIQNIARYNVKLLNGESAPDDMKSDKGYVLSYANSYKAVYGYMLRNEVIYAQLALKLENYKDKRRKEKTRQEKTRQEKARKGKKKRMDWIVWGRQTSFFIS